MLDDAEEEGRGKRNQKGLKGKDTYAGFLRLPRFPIASAVELPQPSSHSLQLVMAGCAHHGVEVQGRRVNQSKLPNTSLFCAGFGGG